MVWVIGLKALSYKSLDSGGFGNAEVGGLSLKLSGLEGLLRFGP